MGEAAELRGSSARSSPHAAIVRRNGRIGRKRSGGNCRLGELAHTQPPLLTGPAVASKRAPFEDGNTA